MIFLSWSKSMQVFLLFVYTWVIFGDLIIKRGKVWITLTGLIKPHLCAGPKQEPWYLSGYVVVFFVFNDLRFEVVDHVVDNGGIVDHHCLNFLFIEWSRRISRNSNDYLKAFCLNYAYWSFRKCKFLNSNLQTAYH